MQLTKTGAKYDSRFEDQLAMHSWTLSHGYLRHYRRCAILGKVRNCFSMQELVWRLAHGVTVKHLDHINGDRRDNRLENLRPSTWTLQTLNSKTHANKKSGLPKGVCLSRCGFQTAIVYHGKTFNIGVFDTPEEASAAYELNRKTLIEHEAALARGEDPPKPVILTVLGPRKRGRPRKYPVVYGPKRRPGRPKKQLPE